MAHLKTAAALALLYGAWSYYQAQSVAPDGGTDWTAGLADQAAGAIDTITGALAFMNTAAAKNVTVADMQNANVQAFLHVIRTGEGTNDANGYRRLFGGQLFDGFADHPRKKVTASGYTSTAAGAYQALSSTWDETRRLMGLKDFSPASQDWFAVGRIAMRGALADVIAGNFSAAVRKCAWEWASLPGSPYGQPVISWDRAAAVFAANGGSTFA